MGFRCLGRIWVAFGIWVEDDDDDGFGMNPDCNGRPSLSRHRCRWEQMGLGLVRTDGFDFDLAGFGCAVLPLDCVFFFWFSYWGLWLWLVGRRWGGCLWLRRSGFWVSGWRCGFATWFFIFFIFFWVLMVDYGLLLAVAVSGVCSALVVVIVVVEQK